MTEEAKRKIYTMYNLFGYCKDENARCMDCGHLQKLQTGSRTVYKCKCYGMSSSEATDWRCSWHACGMIGKPYKGDEVREGKKPKRKPEENIEGQMTLDL